MKKLLLSLCLCCAAAWAWALPSEADVQAQVKAGQYDQAEQAMAQVVAAKPGSAKAHYVYAQILAHQRRFNEAAEHTRQARTLDPALHFTDAAKFKAFEALLAREQGAAGTAAPRALTPPPAQATAPAVVSPQPAPVAGGVPGWVWLAGLGVVGFVLWRAVARGFRAPVTAMPSPAYAPAAPQAATGYGFGGTAPGYGAGYPPGYGPAPASGMRPGMAAAGGLVGGLAAGVLLDQMLHRDHGSATHDTPAAPSGTGLTGVEPGFFDRERSQDAAEQLAQRDIDFGSGNDWDSSSDAGGSGDDW